MGRINPILRSLGSIMAAAPPRWWPPALARRVFPLTAAPNPSDRRVCQFPHGSRNMASGTGVKGREELGESDKDLIPSAMGELSKKEFTIPRRDIGHPGHGEQVDATALYGDAIVLKHQESCMRDCVDYMDVFRNSSHRDGSIYRGIDFWKKDYQIANRNETSLTEEQLSDTKNCIISNGTCESHGTCNFLQFLSFKLEQIRVKDDSLELYGYIAARDNYDKLLNYIINLSRDDPLIVEQGSHINITGPTRGILLYDAILIEYDLRIKIGDQEKDDLQLIDGISFIDYYDTWDRKAFKTRIYGDCGAIEITAVRLDNAVEAVVEIVISEVQGSFSMSLDCFSSGLNKGIRLFDGDIKEPCCLKGALVAVVMGNQMDLRFRVGAGLWYPVGYYCSVKAYKHGRATDHKIKTDRALITVKVNWLTRDQIIK